MKVIKNCGGELGIEDELSMQDPTFKKLSELEQENENGIEGAKAQCGERSLAFGMLTSCDGKMMW